MKVFATGSREGKTFDWRPHSSSDTVYAFVDGACDLFSYPQNELPGVLHYLRLNLQVRTEFEMAAPLATGVDTTAPQAIETNPVRLAILDLDPDNEDLWTPGGLAMVSALAAQFPTIKRAQIDAVASDLTRDKLRG